MIDDNTPERRREFMEAFRAQNPHLFPDQRRDDVSDRAAAIAHLNEIMASADIPCAPLSFLQRPHTDDGVPLPASAPEGRG